MLVSSKYLSCFVRFFIIQLNHWIPSKESCFNLNKYFAIHYHSLHPSLPEWWGVGEWGLSHFSECLYRRDIGQIGILGGNWHFRWVLFFSGGTWKLKKKWTQILSKKMMPIVISTVSRICCPTLTTSGSLYLYPYFPCYIFSPPTNIFFCGRPKIFSCLAARRW